MEKGGETKLDIHIAEPDSSRPGSILPNLSNYRSKATHNASFSMSKQSPMSTEKESRVSQQRPPLDLSQSFYFCPRKDYVSTSDASNKLRLSKLKISDIMQQARE